MPKLYSTCERHTSNCFTRFGENSFNYQIMAKFLTQTFFASLIELINLAVIMETLKNEKGIILGHRHIMEDKRNKMHCNKGKRHNYFYDMYAN